MRKYLLLVSVLLSACLSARAELSLRSVFSDGMVLQQNTQAAIWGTSNPGAQITITASWDHGNAIKCKADGDGNWKASIKTENGSYLKQTIKVSSGKESITVNDVLIGEVWLASGQSNMEMMMDGSQYGYIDCPVRDAMQFISAKPAPDNIRMFTVPRKQTYEPQEDVEGAVWKGASPETIPTMSATSYFFARKLNEMLDVPVGVIVCAFGGAKAESWMPEDLLKSFPEVNLSRDHIEKMFFMHKPFMAYNAMLSPLRGYSIKGFIWYQGCSNVETYETYPALLSAMVKRWRDEWNDKDNSLPFYQVELAPAENTHPQREGMCLVAEFRKIQHEATKMIPNCGIIVTNDLVDKYESWNVHASRKQPVGERLAYLALNRDYGFSTLPCMYPEITSAKLMDDKGTVGIQLSELHNIGLSRLHEVEALEILGEDGQWHAVTDLSNNVYTKTITFRCEGVTNPTEVRYGWADFAPGNLANCYGLPVTPFDVKIEK